MRILKIWLFNYFVMHHLHNPPWYLKWNKRLMAAGLEMAYQGDLLIALLMVVILPTVVVGIIGSLFGLFHFGWVFTMSSVLIYLMLAGLGNKDFFHGQSVVHRYVGFQVVDRNTGMPASGVRCLLRNVTMVLWPIEVLFLMINPERRLGDFIAGTRLAEVPPSNPELLMDEIKGLVFDRQTIWTMCVSVLWVLSFIMIFDPRIGLWRLILPSLEPMP